MLLGNHVLRYYVFSRAVFRLRSTQVLITPPGYRRGAPTASRDSPELAQRAEAVTVCYRMNATHMGLESVGSLPPPWWFFSLGGR